MGFPNFDHIHRIQWVFWERVLEENLIFVADGFKFSNVMSRYTENKYYHVTR